MASGSHHVRGMRPASGADSVHGARPASGADSAHGARPASGADSAHGARPASGTMPVPETRPASGTMPVPETRPVPGTMPVLGTRTVHARRLSAGPPWGRHPAVLHLDIDAFFASVEQLRAPKLRGKPVIVGSGVVASASYEARAFGIGAGTPIREALQRCPQALVLAGHGPTYRAFAARIFDLAAQTSPSVETFLDDALIDLTGTESLHGHLIRASEALRTRIARETGLSVSLGLGTNRMIARMVTRLSKPGGFGWLRPGGERDFVAGRPIEDLPGIGHRRANVLREMGLRRIGDLRAFSRAQLRDLFGEVGLLIRDRAEGRDTRAIHPRELPASIRRETSFHEPVTRRGELEGMLHYLTERAAAHARGLGLQPRRLRVHLRWSDGGRVAAATRLDQPGCRTDALYDAARGLLPGLLDRRKGIHNVGVEIARFHVEPAAQMSLFGADPGDSGVAATDGALDRADECASGASGASGARQERIDRAIDEIRGRFGFRAMLRGPSLDMMTRVPGDAHGFVLRTPCLTR